MRMKKIMFFAVAAIALVACSKTFDSGKTAPEGAAISLGTWADVMTRGTKSAFAANDEFDVFGSKWSSTTDSTSVFEGVDVKYDGTKWSYSPLRYWDPSFDNYTFYAVWPKDQLASGTYAKNGKFVTNDITFDGADEPILVAQKKDVAKTSYNQPVPLVFKHVSSLVDFKVKKHDDIVKSKLVVTSFTLSNIRTKGTFTVASYDGSKNPVGTAGVGGWAPDATPTVASFTKDSGAGVATLPTLIADKGNTTTDAGALIDSLIVMPQAFATGSGAQTFTIAYKLTDESGTENTYTPDPVELGKFDSTNDGDNTATFIASWLPGYHYTYYITINANAITFTASIDNTWATADGFNYLVQ